MLFSIESANSNAVLKRINNIKWKPMNEADYQRNSLGLLISQV